MKRLVPCVSGLLLIALLLLASGALAQSYEMTIHLRSGETVAVPTDTILRLVFDLGQTGIETPGETPAAFRLLNNYPNPFNPSTTIVYEIPTAAAVSVRIFDLQGALVTELLGEMQSAGRHEVTWTGLGAGGERMSSGAYICAVEYDGSILSQRLMLVK